MPLDQLDPADLPHREEKRRAVAAELKGKAHAAMQRRELLVATLHACDALMLFPNEREYLDLFDEIVLSVPDPLSLLPTATGAIHVATAAGKARVLMMQSKLQDALDLVCAAVRVAPDLSYLDWVRRWLMPQTMQLVTWEGLFETAVKTGINLGANVSVPPDAGDPRLPNVRSAAEYFAFLRQQFPNESVLYVGETILRRRMGDTTATVKVAEDGVKRFPENWSMRASVANALCDAKRPDEAIGHARKAMALDPQDCSPLHDVAWGFVDAGRANEAAPLFEEILRRDPHYPGAPAGLHYTRWIGQHSEPDRQALIVLRDQSPYDGRVRALANEVDPAEDYLNVLPGPADATAAAARHLLGELGPILQCCGAGATVGFELSSRYLDSPSVGVAFEVGLRSMGAGGGTIECEPAEIQAPDPRTDKAQLPFRLWSYEGHTPRKVYSEADPRAQQAVASLAVQPFRRETWDAAARQVAGQVPPDGVHGLLAVLTHPPPVADGFDAIHWTWRCQVATAVILSHVGPWQNGPGKAALYTLLYGPSDWVVGAAIVAWGWRALENPALRGEVLGSFAWLRQQLPANGYTAWELPLASLTRVLLDPADPARREVEAWIDRYFETLPDKNSCRRPVRRYGGLTLAEYANFCLERDKLIGGIGYQGVGAAASAFVLGNVPPGVAELCQKYNVPLRNPVTGGFYPFIVEWQEAMNADPDLHAEFLDIQKHAGLAAMGVSGKEAAALEQIVGGNMDMHLRMAQAQAAQREAAGGDPDPVVFPGQPVARLSDYVRILKGMQRGDMNGALAQYGLNMMSYGQVATAWGAKMAADPLLTEKFSKMMQS